MSRKKQGKASRAPRMARITEEPTDAAGAAALFRKRTGVKVTDPAVRTATNMALLAGMFETVAGMEKWASPIREVIAKDSPPTLPAWFARVNAAAKRGVGKQPVVTLTHGESAAVAPGKQVELVATVKGVVKQVAALGTAIAQIKETLETVEQLDRELRAVQVDPSGRAASFVEPHPPHRPGDEGKLRFARRLAREWARAGRPPLGATEIALAAVAVGLDTMAGGLSRVIERWSKQIGRDKARTNKLLAAMARAAAPAKLRAPAKVPAKKPARRGGSKPRMRKHGTGQQRLKR